MSHLRRRVVFVFTLVSLVATTSLGQIQRGLQNDATTGSSRSSSRTCRVTTLVNTRKVHDDDDESRNSHVSVAPLAIMELSYWSSSHEYASDFESHYLWDLALSNVNIELYRRERKNLPLRTWSNGCGMRAEEQLLLPNHGRDAAVFYDYAAWRYDAPPQAVVFLHGHGALAWHTSCETVFTRITAYHEHVLLRRNDSESIPTDQTVVTRSSRLRREEEKRPSLPL